MSRRHIVMQLLVTQQETQAWRAPEDCLAVARLLTTIVALREWSAVAWSEVGTGPGSKQNRVLVLIWEF